MHAHELGVEFTFDQFPFEGYGGQNDHLFSGYIADALDLHFEQPFPHYHQLPNGDEGLKDIHDRMRNFNRVSLPETVLFNDEVPVVLELLGVATMRGKEASENKEFDNPYAALCTGSMRTLVASLQTHIGEEPILPPRYIPGTNTEP